MARNYILHSPFSEPEPEGLETPGQELSLETEPDRLIYTVSELAGRIQGLLEETFSAGVWVEGELSEPKVYPSGHLWFDLKDAQASLKAVMWRDDVRRLKFQPQQGLKVICFGKLDFYPPRGEVKFVVRSLEPKGMGALQLAFEQLKGRLQKEGLFAEERKRPLPVFPERIGLVTSPRGAAIDDMLKVLKGQVEVVLNPARVQGNEAAEAIARGIRGINALDGVDLIIVGRGGGSLEDLWAFNEEVVARAIAESCLPVISAVGHEKDVTIADLVADLRAATPTKAAEIVLAQRRAYLDRFLAVLEEPAFTEPEEWLKELQERVEEMEGQMLDSLREPLLDSAHRLRVLQGGLLAASPQMTILHQAQKLETLKRRLESDMIHLLERTASHYLGLVGRLNALSPLAVLERGYSITFDSDGKILKESRRVKSGDLIQTQLHRGRIQSRVESTGE